MVVNLTALDDGDFLVQKLDDGAHDAAFGLALFPQKNDVMVGQEGVHQLGEDRLLKAMDQGKEGLAGLQTGDEVLFQLLLDGQVLVYGGLEFLEIAGFHGFGSFNAGIFSS